ncbi:MAG: rod shape-determining protein MreC [Kiritimatiellae bacterium]|nr:rod shape-determining protein MreC [Kiritimatiellia bacterium]
MLKGRLFITIVTAVTVVALWVIFGRSAAIETVYPVENGRNWFYRSVVSPVKAVFHPMAVDAENRRLKAELEKNKINRTVVDNLLNEMVRLRKALNYPPSKDFTSWIASPVLGYGGAIGASGMMRVGKGSLDGVSVGSAVVVPDGIVGRVVEVTPHTAVVRLITSDSLRISCEVESNDPQFGKVRGVVYGGSMTKLFGDKSATVQYCVNPLVVRHLNRDISIPSRARIVTSGLGGVYPKGYLIGYLVDEVKKDETGLEREGMVIPSADLAALEDVFIHREK